MQALSINQIKKFSSLKTAKGRKKHGLFLAEGDRSVLQMLENNLLEVSAIILRDEIASSNIPVHFHSFRCLAGESDFLSIAESVTPQNLLAVFKIPGQTHPSKLNSSAKNLLYLDRIQDPGNLGTIYRTAAWFGFDGIILAKGSADLFQPKVVRSTAGATAAVPFFYDEDGAIISELQQNGWQWLVTTLSEDSVALDKISFSSKNVLVIGNEGSGVAAHFMNNSFLKVHIPGSGNAAVESLNAAVSAGIVMSRLAGS